MTLVFRYHFSLHRSDVYVIFLLTSQAASNLLYAYQASYSHLASSAIPAIILAPLLVWVLRPPLMRGLRSGVTVLFIIYGAANLMSDGLAWSVFQASDPLRCYSELAAAGCVKLPAGQQEVVEYIQSQSAKEDYVYVGTGRHDRIYWADLSMNFLMDRKSPIRSLNLLQDITTEQNEQRAMAARLQIGRAHV